MSVPKRLLCIFAHPDDETLGMGPVLAKYAAEGVEISLICATRGERGWFDSPETHPGLIQLGQVRQEELLAAAQCLGISRVDFLDVVDGELGQADTAAMLAKIVPIIRQVRPQVVVSFDPMGIYGHPDHIAISQLASAAILCAADPGFAPGAGGHHRVSKFYYMLAGELRARAYVDQGIIIQMEVEGTVRKLVPWPEWAITTRIQAAEYIPAVQQAIRCHQTQMPSLPGFDTISQENLTALMGELGFYRAYSLVNQSCERETDFFQGIVTTEEQ